MKIIQNLEEFITKFQKKDLLNPLDVSQDHDLAVGIMNLIAIEEHLFFTGAKTEKTIYYDMIDEIREMRKELLKIIIKDSEGELWCTSKHLLSSSMRMMEVGTKCQTLGKNEEAYSFFEKSYRLYTIFWGINMNLLDQNSVKNEIKEQEEKDPSKPAKIETKLSDNIKKWKNILMEKLNCCRE